MSIYFPLDLLEQVRQSAKANHRSFNQEVVAILDRVLNRATYEKKERDAREKLMEEAELQHLKEHPETVERLMQEEWFREWWQARKDVDNG